MRIIGKYKLNFVFDDKSFDYTGKLKAEVYSSRVRLAINIKGTPFTSKFKKFGDFLFISGNFWSGISLRMVKIKGVWREDWVANNSVLNMIHYMNNKANSGIHFEFTGNNTKNLISWYGAQVSDLEEWVKYMNNESLCLYKLIDGNIHPCGKVTLTVNLDESKIIAMMV